MNRFARLLPALGCLCALMLVFAGCGTTEDHRPPGAELPKDYPLEQIPLVDGTVLSATGSRADGWSVTIQGKAGEGNVLESAVTTLTEHGFTESQRTGEGAQKVVMLSAKKENTTYWVQVGITAGAAGGGSSVFYQVSAG